MLKRIDQLTAGMLVAREVQARTGQVLVQAGTQLEDRHIGLLRTWGVANVDVQADAADAARLDEMRRRCAPRFAGQATSHPVVRELFRLAVERAAAAPDAAPETPPAPGPQPSGKAPALDQLVERAGQLGSLPDTWQRLNDVVAKPTATTAQIAEVIAIDAGLSARVLRLANSPLFGLSMRISQVTQAVNVIGTRQIRDLALASTVIDRFKDVPPELANMERFWRHSLASGLAARAIAARRREANVERFLVAGLLHDVGLPLLLTGATSYERAAMERCADRRTPLDEAERTLLGYDHAAAGAALLGRWRLPPELVEPVERHHEPALAMSQRITCAAVHIGVITVDLLGIAPELAGRAPTMDPRACDTLAVEPTTLAEVAAEVDGQLEDVLAILTGKA